MAKPIELGLTLEGEDARRFHEYMERPTYTDDARKLIRFAAQRAQNHSFTTGVVNTFVHKKYSQ